MVIHLLTWPRSRVCRFVPLQPLHSWPCKAKFNRGSHNSFSLKGKTFIIYEKISKHSQDCALLVHRFHSFDGVLLLGLAPCRLLGRFQRFRETCLLHRHDFTFTAMKTSVIQFVWLKVSLVKVCLFSLLSISVREKDLCCHVSMPLHLPVVSLPTAGSRLQAQHRLSCSKRFQSFLPRGIFSMSVGM